MGKEIMLKRYGKNQLLEVFPTFYASNRSLAIVLYDRNEGEQDSILTVCLDDAPGLNKAYIDVNNQGYDVLGQLVSCGLGKPTGRTRRSGYATYPEFEFNGAILRECDTEGYSKYLEWYDKLEEDEEYLLASCKKCRKEHAFIVKKAVAEKYREYLAGEPYLIQDIFPDMEPAERGLLATGQKLCPDCFREMFG